MKKLLSLIRSCLFIFVFLFTTLGSEPKGSCCDLCQRVFFSKSFIVSGLRFRSLIHFEFIFMYGVR